MKTNFKTPVLSAIAFFWTLGILSVGYSAYSGLSSVTPSTPLTVALWTQVKDNFDDINWRLSNFSFSSGNVGIWGVPTFKFDVPQTTWSIAWFGNLVVNSWWNTDVTFDGRNFAYMQSIYGRWTTGAWKMGYDASTMRSAMIADGPIMSMEDGAYFAGKVGIGTSSPSEKLEVNGNIKFSGNGSVISKAPRAIHSTDPVTGCPPSRPANSDLWTMPMTLDRPATVFLSGDLIKNSTLRWDLQLYLNGNFLMQTIAPAVSNDWAWAHVQWTWTLPAGNHVVSLRSPQANIWWCGTNWGTMDALIFEH